MAAQSAAQIVLGRLAGAVGQVVRAQHREGARQKRGRGRHECRKEHLQRHGVGRGERGHLAAKTARIHSFL
jgi:hypothetical protein